MRTIIVVTTSYYPFLGGAEVAIAEITKRLSKDFRFVIVAARQERKLPVRENRPEGTIIRIGVGSALLDKWLLAFLGGFFIAWKIKFGEWKNIYKKKECALLGVDISQGALAATVVSFLLPRVPFVLNLQYGNGEKRLAKGRGGIIKHAFQWMLARADFVTAISTYLLKVAREQPYYYRDSAVIIPNGVDLEKFFMSKEKIPHMHPTVITVSRLVNKNGIDTLIRAIKEVKKQMPDICCNIVGNGPERENLEKQVRDEKLQDTIIFLGNISHNEIPKYLHEADVFVRSSRSEGMGNVFVEALAAGLPIIGTPVGGITDIIENEKTGLFANIDDESDLAEKIMIVLNNHKLTQSIVVNGSAMVRERFSWNSIAEKYKNILNTVLSSSRVVIAAPLFPPDVGGPATYVYMLREDLWKQNILLKIEYFGNVRHLPKVIRHFIYFWKICCKARGKDTVFAQDPVSTGFPAMIAAKILQKKFLLKIVGDYAWEQWQQSKTQNTHYTTQERFIDPEEFQKLKLDWKIELIRKIEHLVAKRTDRIIVPSNYLKKIIMMWGVLNEKIFVISNAFEIEQQPHEFFRNLQIQRLVLISAGRLVPWKGFETLVRIMPKLKQKFPNCKLSIIGDGPSRKDLCDLISSLHLENTVSIQGPLPHKNFLENFYSGRIFILNTGYEGFSHVLLEAMATGIPVITTNVCGNPEIIENGKEGILVDYNDSEGILRAIEMLIENPDLREKIIMAAKEKVKQFNKEKMVNRTKEILNL